MSKTCIACDQTQPSNQFVRKSNPNTCRTCLNAYNRKYYHQHKDGARRKMENYRRTIDGRATLIINQMRARCKKYGRRFALTKKTIVRKLLLGVCERSGLPLNTDNILMFWENPLGPSVDRIDSNDGYTDENVQIVCNMYNLGKSKFDEVDFIAMCCAVAERNRDDPRVVKRLRQLRGDIPRPQGDLFGVTP